MSPTYPNGEPTREALLAEVAVLRQQVAALQQAKHDLDVMLEMSAEHADHLSDTLIQERNDMEMMLEMTTEHSDALEEELQIKAEALEARNQFIQDTFGRYVSDDVVAQLLDLPEGIELGGEKCTVTILMSDLRGFTAVAERLDAQEVMTFLNRYLEAMVSVILSYRGTIIEILGDGLLVIFGAPLQQVDDAERAVACAVAMQLQMAGVNAILAQEGLAELEMGIGIHTGEVVVGTIGSRQRAKYGVVGSAVNLVGRIESYTTGNQVLISPTTYHETASILNVIHQMRVDPKGVSTPITIYDVGGIGGAYQLFLPGHTETLVPLDMPVPVRCAVLKEKFTGQSAFLGRVVKLSTTEAELHTDQPVVILSNLKIQLEDSRGNPVSGDLFVKVVAHSPTSATGVVVRFTSMSKQAKVFLTSLLPPSPSF